MKPPIKGPKQGPVNGAAETSAIGTWILSRWKMSPAVPPDTDKKVPPKKPVKKRVMIMVWMFFATAVPIVQMRNSDQAKM